MYFGEFPIGLSCLYRNWLMFETTTETSNLPLDIAKIKGGHKINKIVILK